MSHSTHNRSFWIWVFLGNWLYWYWQNTTYIQNTKDKQLTKQTKPWFHTPFMTFSQEMQRTLFYNIGAAWGGATTSIIFSLYSRYKKRRPKINCWLNSSSKRKAFTVTRTSQRCCQPIFKGSPPSDTDMSKKFTCRLTDIDAMFINTTYCTSLSTAHNHK